MGQTDFWCSCESSILGSGNEELQSMVFAHNKYGPQVYYERLRCYKSCKNWQISQNVISYKKKKDSNTSNIKWLLSGYPELSDHHINA